MRGVHVLSLKVGNSHGLWQCKLEGTHERIIMHGVHNILDRTCRLLGIDAADRSAVYLFSFCAEPFQGYQVCLGKIREIRGQHGTSCSYKVIQSNIQIFEALGLFPAFVSAKYFHRWPDRIFFKLERSMTGEIVS
jgi:hypothetical protein